MRTRLFKSTWITLAVVSLLLPTAVAAQDGDGPVLWISYITAEPGKSSELGMYLGEEGAKTYDGLIADGHVMSWGVAQAVNHFPNDDWTHLEFVNFRNWASVGEFINRFMGKMQAMTPEERMEAGAKWDELTVHGSHYDTIGRHRHLAVGGGTPGYISLSTFSMSPGASVDAAKEIYKKWRAPIMDELMEAGTINAHGIYTMELHPTTGWADMTGWFTMPGLGAMDTVEAALVAADDARTEEQQAEWIAEVSKVFEMPAEGNHTDRVLVVLHYNAAEAPAE